MTTTPDPLTAAIDAERAAFERWAKEHGRIFLDLQTPGLVDFGPMYANQFTQEAWVGWQARASLAPSPGVGWKLVPVKPTHDMLSAMSGYRFGVDFDAAEDHSFRDDLYAEILAAAPPAPPHPASDVRMVNAQVLAALKALRLAREQNKYPSWEKGVPDFNRAEALADAAITAAEAAQVQPAAVPADPEFPRMTYQPRHSIIGVEIDGCEFTTDTELLPWVHKQTPEGTERYQPCVVHGVKINGVWFDACAMGDDFIEEMEYEIERMPLNAEGDIDEAALRMGKAEVEKRAAALSQPAPAPRPAAGLTVQSDADGVWLAFAASTGRHALLNVDRIADSHGGIVSKALRDWAADVSGATP